MTPERRRGAEKPEPLSARLILSGIKRCKKYYGAGGADIVVMQSAASTNDEAKTLASRGAAHGSLVLAEGQTGGRGRGARVFFSPPGAGLYMSVVLRPRAAPETAPLLTFAAAVAVCRAVRMVAGLKPSVKWVNDALINEKKVCGILTESSTDSGGGKISFAVVGIGVNVSARDEDFPPELRGTAGSIFPGAPRKISRNALAAVIADELLALCDEISDGDRAFMDEYRSYSCVNGRRVEYSVGRESGAGEAAGIDADGRLLVRRDADGEIIALNSGEVAFMTGPRLGSVNCKNLTFTA